jgi:biopolymer transport protein ExbB
MKGMTSMSKRWTMWTAVVVLAGLMCVAVARAQAPAADAPAAGALVAADGGAAAPAAPKADPNNFYQIVFGSGWLGVLIWIGLFGVAGGGVYFSVDSFITVRPKRIMPQSLIDNVTAAMAEGDVLKALKHCEDEPCPLASILSAGFSHVEEGFDVIQESVTAASDFETEKIMQKLTWISVMGSLAPMLGLLGTVQGMIMAFANIATGAPDVGMLAMAIAQALYTTAAGLFIAIPCIGAFYNMRNSASRSFLMMQALTMELIKDLRNVEVVSE